MRIKSLSATLAILIIAVTCFAQEKASYKFNKLTAEDFSPKVYSIDSNATAIILADVGSTSFEGNKKGWFTMIFKRHIRARILSNAARDFATIKIRLYKKDDEEESLEDVKASTFNESNGSIIETPLDKHDIFQEKLDKNHTEKKFSLPAVKEGSVIDIAYTIKSDFTFNLQPWEFQHISYPCLWSEYIVVIPGLLDYMCLKQGYDKYYIEKKSQKAQAYRVVQKMDRSTYGTPERELVVSTINTTQHWAMKDLPALTDMDHLTSPDNYVDKVEFQLYKTYNGETTTDVMNTWPMVTAQLMKEDDFGGALLGDNYWLDKDVSSIADNKTDQLEVSKKVYEYVKNNYTCTGNGYLIKTKLSDVFKTRKGNAGEINLILIAMLRKKGISADPVLASTRSNGRPYDEYPMLAKYNYAFCRAAINNRFYYLDANHPFLGFGKLDPECYNGKARVINSSAEIIDLSSDSLRENKNTYIVINSDDNGNLEVV